MIWTGIPAVPGEVSAGMAQFLQAVKNNLESAKSEIESAPTASTGTTTVVTGSGGNAPPSIMDYGGNPDGVSNNDAAFALAEASTYDEIYIPDGVFLCSTRTSAQFSKGYKGPGNILTADGYALPGTTTYLATTPTIWPTQGIAGYFRGDYGLNRGEWKTVGPGARTGAGASTRYFDHQYQGRTCWLYVYDGSSGFQGQSAIPRTHTTQDYIFVRNFGGYGDVYGSTVRMEQRFTPSAGQTHFFATSTTGMYGGDVNFLAGSGGTYATGWESQYLDQSNDVAVIAQVDSFVRNNDTGARGCVWLGTYFKSEGAKPSDAAHVVSGKWRVGLDTTKADLSTFLTAADGYNAAISTAIGHKWVMNSQALVAGRGGDATFGTFFGNTPGDMFIESGNDVSGDYIALRFNRVAPNDCRLRIRPTSVQINKTLLVAQDVNAGANIALAGTGILAFGAGTGNYITYDGTAFRFYKAGVLAGSI